MTTALYVAGPMTGLPEFNYPEFLRVATELRWRGFRVLCPAEIDDMYLTHTLGRRPDWQWYMRKALTMVCEADGVATLAGWDGSRGARLEVHVARALDLEVRRWQEWETP